MCDDKINTRNLTICSPRSSSLTIKFLPRSIIEQWVFAQTPDEMATILEEILEIYESFDEMKRIDCRADISSIIQQTLISLQMDSLSVALNGLKLLELISSLHSQEFLGTLEELFTLLLIFMDHPRVALRHHSLRLAGSLVVRLPSTVTLKYLFASLERRPYHPEIPLKCAALALLSIQPTPSNKILSTCTPLIIRILGLSGDYLSTNDSHSHSNETLSSPRGIIVSDSAKDLLAIGTMIFCILSLSKLQQQQQQQQQYQENSQSLEDLFPKKLQSMLGNPLSEAVVDDICRRGLQSDFPSLGGDPHLSELSSIAMENSLHQIDQCLKESPAPSIQSSHTPMVVVTPTQKPSIPRPPSGVSVPRLSLKPKVQETIVTTPTIQINISTPDSISSVTEEMYQPSWSASPDIASHPLSIEHDIEGYSTTLDSPWTKIHEPRIHTPVDSNVDRTKLTSIKRIGRKSASRRVRTANDLPTENIPAEEWTTPASANARLVSVGENSFGPQLLRNSNDDLQMEYRNSEDSILPSTPHQSTTISENVFDEKDMVNELPPKKRPTKVSRFKIPLDQNPSQISQNNQNQQLHSREGQSPSPHPKTTRERLFSDEYTPGIATGTNSGTTNGSGHSNTGHSNSGGGHGSEILTTQDGIPINPDAFEYLTIDEIQPCEKPQRELSRIVTDLIQKDWPEIFSTLNIVRQLAIHHKQALIQSGQLHSIVLGVNKQVENLRSTAAKNAILALGDLYYSLKSGMDPEIVSSSTILIKRLSDSSLFITESVMNSLMIMIQNVSFHRSHAALMNGFDNKHATIRGQCVKLLLFLYQTKGREVLGTIEMETMLGKLNKMVRDTSPESRKYSRGLVKELIESELLPRGKLIELVGEDIVNTSLRSNLSLSTTITQRKQLNSSSQFNSTNGFDSSLRFDSPIAAGTTLKRSPVQNHSLSPSTSTSGQVPKLSLPKAAITQNLTDPPLMVSGVSPRGVNPANNHQHQQQQDQPQHLLHNHHHNHHQKSNHNPPPLTKQQQENYPEIVILQTIFQAVNSKNWQERRDNLTTLCDLLIQHHDLYQRANKHEKCFEIFLEHFEDGSVKVVLHSISCVLKIHHHYPSLLNKLLPISLPAVLSVESSANKQISIEGSNLLDILIKDSPDIILAQQLIRIAVHEKERIRASAFRAITKYILIFPSLIPSFSPFSSSSGSSIQLENDNRKTHFENILRRNFFPLICQTLCASTTKPDIKTAAIETLRTIQSTVHPEYVGNWTDSSQYKDEIKRLL